MMVSGSMELLNRRRNCIISASDQTGHSAIEQKIIDFNQNKFQKVFMIVYDFDDDYGEESYFVEWLGWQ